MMKVLIDNQIVQLLVSDPTKIFNQSSIFNVNNHVSFRWPSLLEYLGLGSILLDLPLFDPNQASFQAYLSILCAQEDNEIVFHLYDRLFADSLSQVSALPQIHPTFLLQAINEARQKISLVEVDQVLSPILTTYEMLLTTKTSHTMHDLILYLAWEWMCICIARIFDYQSSNPNFIKGIGVLRDCLIESYQHITKQGRTVPNLYRMLESFLFYEMREENLEKHTPTEWSLLSQSFQGVKSQDRLADCYYIDEIPLFGKEMKSEDDNNIAYLTLDSPNRINTRLSLAQYMIGKLQPEMTTWDCVLCQNKITCIEL